MKAFKAREEMYQYIDEALKKRNIVHSATGQGEDFRILAESSGNVFHSCVMEAYCNRQMKKREDETGHLLPVVDFDTYMKMEKGKIPRKNFVCLGVDVRRFYRYWGIEPGDKTVNESLTKND